ncbi:hypothetical protein J4419_02605 [Candidatus Woesearchaeota archaeon]|nr:hypothetical protein [Candidatus Woesearchaeota archaeon]
MRKPNAFEWVLLMMGLLCIGIGYILVQAMAYQYGFFSVQTSAILLLWFIFIACIVLAAVNENSKEELRTIIRQQHEELRMLRVDLRRKR